MESKKVLVKLVEMMKDDELVIEMISDTMKSCSRYVDLINQQEVLVSVAKYNLSKEQLLYEVKALDEQRRRTHNSIIAGIKAINRMCESEGLELFYKGSDERSEIGEFAFEIVGDSFKNRER